MEGPHQTAHNLNGKIESWKKLQGNSHSDDLHDGSDKDLAVPDLSGVGGSCDCAHNLVHLSPVERKRGETGHDQAPCTHTLRCFRNLHAMFGRLDQDEPLFYSFLLFHAQAALQEQIHKRDLPTQNLLEVYWKGAGNDGTPVEKHISDTVPGLNHPLVYLASGVKSLPRLQHTCLVTMITDRNRPAVPWDLRE